MYQPIKEVCPDSVELKCTHKGECPLNSTMVHFYKGEELIASLCMYKTRRNLNVSECDRMVIYPYAYLPYLKTSGDKDRLKMDITQMGAFFTHTVDLTGINVLDFKNSMYICGDLDRYGDFLSKFDFDSGYLTTSEEESDEEE